MLTHPTPLRQILGKSSPTLTTMSPSRLGIVKQTSRTIAANPAAAVAVKRPSPYSQNLVPGGGINASIERLEYAVRGALVIRAEALADQLERGEKLPFDRVTYCNIGNPQSVGQSPITFVRQVLAAVVCPDMLLRDPETRAKLPGDVVSRAEQLLKHCHGVGAYTESKGIPFVRQTVAEALSTRDGGAPTNPDDIFLTNGASEGVKTVLNLLVRDSTDGVMIPTPQYPLYSATLQALNGRQVGYYLDESDCWAMSVADLEKTIAKAKQEGTNVRALCVINPGNPTGQALSRANVEGVVAFCQRHNLALLADEVYQRNVYGEENSFVSFKRVVHEMQSPIELASFHSISKGVFGECGIRGGFVELYNMHQHANDMVYKVLSVSLCANVPGQVVVDLMMKPPQPGDPSFELYDYETRQTYESLQRKGAKLAAGLNTFTGVSCNPPQGAMYLFPQVDMPVKAQQVAAEKGLAAVDVLYCLELLDATGICVVPGSGFGQVPGTFHFRTTFLPPEEHIDEVVVRMRTFHDDFLRRYS